ncbi:MAG: SUMF1/EgtB/PvdO family nonheme iron enzyme [Planctomycetes bacterium]|nr:SUMF1/EgtB/PvdO family nonheme iron enzyme [Planctomycetota bacterium]
MVITKGMDRQMWCVSLLVACGWFTAFLTPAAASNAEEQDMAQLYAKKGTWAETMITTRAVCAKQLARPVITLGYWYYTQPKKFANFSQRRVLDNIDFEERSPNGKKCWKPKMRIENRKVYAPIRLGVEPIYMVLTITVDGGPASYPVHLACSQGYDLWFNGRKIQSKNVRCDVERDQDRFVLDLKPGDNKLLLKIHNSAGLPKFYFSRPVDPARFLWEKIAKDFPRHAMWINEDAGDDKIHAWLRSPDKVELEQEFIAAVAAEIGLAGELLLKDFDALQQADVAAGDAQWLTLYERSAQLRDRFRTARRYVTPESMRALRMAVEDLGNTEHLERLADIERRVRQVLDGLARGQESILAKTDRILAYRRQALLANPLLDFDRLLLVKRSIDQLGLPRNWLGNCALDEFNFDNEIAVLSPVKPSGELTTFYKPDHSGFVGDVDLNFDADKMLFSMPGSHGRWHVWEIQADGTGLRQLTETEHTDVENYDACYMPDGRIVFASTRCFAGVPCIRGKQNVANLCVMDADGGNIRQLCFDQDHNWSPAMLNNGRVLFTRWEYSDTSHYFSILLFHMNPDGTGQAEYYGSNSYWPNAIFFARPIPDHPTQVVGIVSGHHGVPRMGELVIFDPAKGRHEADGVVQRIPGYGKKVEPIIKDALVDDSWPKFLHPYPLSDKYFLVSSQLDEHSNWGIYLVDIFDNMLLLKEEPGYVLFEPLPWRKTERPPVLPNKVDLKSREATVHMVDVYDGPGLEGVPRGTVKNLRIYEFHYAYPKMGGWKDIAVDGGWDIRRILGTVPVYEDGSAAFTVPANTPLAVQPLDEEGRAIQLMRSWFTAMPGESLSCVGCHERQNTVPAVKRTIASNAKPSDIVPWYGPARGFSFNREVQPVLDKYCVGCHNDESQRDGVKMLDLAAKEKNGWKNFPPAYLALHPYVRRPGPESNYHIDKALEYHANTSELVQMLEKGHYNVKLDEEAWDRLVTWIDLNVPAHGTWGESEQIQSDFHQRRLEMRTRYANRPEDPEAILAVDRGPIEFVRPEPMDKPQLASAVDITGWPFNGETARVRQSAAGLKTRRTIDMGNGITIDLVLIPAGQFVMGSFDGYPDERPATPVTVEDPFWMGVMEVTNEQFQRIYPDHDNAFLDKQKTDHISQGYSIRGARQPAIRVSWSQAISFCRKLSELTGETVDLPTEAQWEWACRAGTDTPLYFGDLDTDFSSHANLADDSIKLLALGGETPNEYEAFNPRDRRFNDGEKIMADSGKYAPNPWGLHDMHGNVWEWTSSLFKTYPYREDDGRNEIAQDGDRVVRGGSWYDRPKRARSAFRLAYRPYQRVYNVGFRVVIPAKASSLAKIRNFNEINALKTERIIR